MISPIQNPPPYISQRIPRGKDTYTGHLPHDLIEMLSRYLPPATLLTIFKERHSNWSERPYPSNLSQLLYITARVIGNDHPPATEPRGLTARAASLVDCPVPLHEYSSTMQNLRKLGQLFGHL